MAEVTVHDLIRAVGETPGYTVEAVRGGFKLVRQPIPAHGMKPVSIKVGSTTDNRALLNVITRMRREAGWSFTLHKECQDLDHEHRVAGTKPGDDQLAAVLKAAGHECSTHDGSGKPIPAQANGTRRHGKTGGPARSKVKPQPAASTDDDDSPVIITGGEIRAEEISPARAATLLENLAPYQRPLRTKKVQDYAAAMARGEWVLMPSDPLCIDTEGRTNNGQHRLWAVIECGQPQKFYVAYDVEPSTYTKMDRGIARTTADALSGAGEVQSTALAAVAGLAHLWFHVPEQEDWKGHPRISETQISAIIEAHPGLRDSVRLGRIGKGMKISDAASRFGHYLITRKLKGDPTLVTQWYRDIGNMALTPGSPGHTLGLYLLKAKPGANRRTELTKRPKRDLDLYLLLQAWNNTCQGKEVRGVSWKETFVIPDAIAPTGKATFNTPD